MINKSVKKPVLLVVALALGSILGFFGVFVSVFSDGGLYERLITISVILLIYFFLGLAFGVFVQGFSGILALVSGLPGDILLLLYFKSEPNKYYLIYGISIILLSWFGAFIGVKIKKSRK